MAIKTPWIGRRRLITGLASAITLPLAPKLVLAEGALVTTPRQTEGPFYPVDWSGDVDNDLVLVKGEAAQAMGHITHVFGRVLDAAGGPIQDARIEIWQCDNTGIYRHPRDTSWFRERKPDQGFQSRGRAVTDASGGYSFRTIRPVAYPGRTPHIHFKIEAPGKPALITQMYVAGDPGNERDGILNSLDPRQRDSVIVKLDAADRIETGALAGTFDIVLG